MGNADIAIPTQFDFTLLFYYVLPREFHHPLILLYMQWGQCIFMPHFVHETIISDEWN